jgi:hypothetical protein
VSSVEISRERKVCFSITRLPDYPITRLPQLPNAFTRLPDYRPKRFWLSVSSVEISGEGKVCFSITRFPDYPITQCLHPITSPRGFGHQWRSVVRVRLAFQLPDYPITQLADYPMPSPDYPITQCLHPITRLPAQEVLVISVISEDQW